MFGAKIHSLFFRTLKHVCIQNKSICFFRKTNKQNIYFCAECDSQRVNSAPPLTSLGCSSSGRWTYYICLDCMTTCETPKYVHVCWYLCACTIHCGTQRRRLNPPSRLLSAGGKRGKGCRKESSESNIITAISASCFVLQKELLPIKCVI